MSEIHTLIAKLEDQSSEMLSSERALSPQEADHVRAVHQAMPLLRQAAEFFAPETQVNNLVTYKIVSDVGGRLKAATRIACNFWNNFLVPSFSVVVRVGTFDGGAGVIAQAWKPYYSDGVWYGEVEFNTYYLATFSSLDIAGTIAHEIGHTLGMGFEEWMPLFDEDTGKFFPRSIDKLPSLAEMEVERDGGRGTALSHWDEDEFGAELMTGYKNTDMAEHVLPVTVDVMELLGHRIIRRLPEKTPLDTLLLRASQMQFTRQAQAKSLDLDFHKRTEIFETIPHQPLDKPKKRKR